MDIEMLCLHHLSSPNDNNLEPRQSQQPIYDANSSSTDEHGGGGFQRRNEDSLFCSPGPDENTGLSSNVNPCPGHLALSGDPAAYEQHEQRDIGPSILYGNDVTETTRNRKRTLVSPFELDETCTGSNASHEPTAESKPRQTRKRNGPNVKRGSKSSRKYWQKNIPTLSRLGANNSIQRSIQHAQSNAEKPEIPSFSTKNQNQALKDMVANAPTETREEALTDRQFFNQALLAFTKKPKLDGRGGWLHPNMATSLFHYQLIGAGFMRNREKSTIPPFGGFQCDEMGFGKTIQAIGPRQRS
ncbi:DNA repair helicase rad5,16 [Histoplasma capsulatum G186AR]|uniref:DNA repair helicase rad5,16 n=1 Tax=Ajellomyces capsulatus TaxID=5037 RepID=A0A8H7ZBL6_AJECA|nr:DNA repair helicase rad5,16 [Histoplasma capsulatum]QSS75727.1 DNA repair helicase rad5,16 [Histoplasma capsulatum G186AR]